MTNYTKFNIDWERMFSNRFLKGGTQVVATIDIVTSVLSFISLFFIVFLTIVHGDRLEVKVEKDQDKHPELAALFALGRRLFILAILILMVVCVAYFYLARYLLHAANERSYAKIHRWCTITLVLIITRAAFFITAAFFTADTAFVSSFGFIGFLYQLFCLWFVRMYEDRLRACGIKAANFDTLEEDDGSCTSSSVGVVGMDSFVIGLGGEDRRYSMSSSKLKASTASAAACQFSQQNELHGQKSCGHLEKT